jgi:hypothetical protein
VILHFGDWHGEPPLVSQVYSERVLTSRVPLLLRGKLGQTAEIELCSGHLGCGQGLNGNSANLRNFSRNADVTVSRFGASGKFAA